MKSSSTRRYRRSYRSYNYNDNIYEKMLLHVILYIAKNKGVMKKYIITDNEKYAVEFSLFSYLEFSNK